MHRAIKLLANKTVQRPFFSLALLFWLSLLYNRVFKYGGGESSFGISYELLLVIPTMILLFHIVFLNLYSWALAFIVFVLLLFGVSKDFYNDYFLYHGSPVKDYMNNSESFITWGFIFIGFVIIGFFMWRMKPIAPKEDLQVNKPFR